MSPSARLPPARRPITVSFAAGRSRSGLGRHRYAHDRQGFTDRHRRTAHSRVYGQNNPALHRHDLRPGQQRCDHRQLLRRRQPILLAVSARIQSRRRCSIRTDRLGNYNVTITNGTLTVLEDDVDCIGHQYQSARKALPSAARSRRSPANNPIATATDFTATINWGDGHSLSRLGAGELAGGFQISGTNTYADNGSYPISLSIHDNAGQGSTISASARLRLPMFRRRFRWPLHSPVNRRQPLHACRLLYRSGRRHLDRDRQLRRRQRRSAACSGGRQDLHVEPHLHRRRQLHGDGDRHRQRQRRRHGIGHRSGQQPCDVIAAANANAIYGGTTTLSATLERLGQSACGQDAALQRSTATPSARPSPMPAASRH